MLHIHNARAFARWLCQAFGHDALPPGLRPWSGGAPAFGRDAPAFGRGAPAFGRGAPAFGRGAPGRFYLYVVSF